MSGVLAIPEVNQAALHSSAREILAVGRQLADELGEPLVVLLAGPDATATIDEAGALGADRVIIAQCDAPTGLSPRWLCSTAAQVCTHVDPTVVLITHADSGRQLGPDLGFRLRAGVVTDATAVRLDGGQVLVTKPVYGGSAVGEFAVLSRPSVVTLRPRSFTEATATDTRQPAIEHLAAAPDDTLVDVLDVVLEATGDGPQLKEASTVVTGGRGIGGPEHWHHVEELARTLGAAVGATRAVTDSGWVPPGLQVGLTGATVAPELYVAIGVSGAVQHLAGMSGARNVVAINKDADANIFRHARFGIVGDWQHILPSFQQRLTELRG